MEQLMARRLGFGDWINLIAAISFSILSIVDLSYGHEGWATIWLVIAIVDGRSFYRKWRLRQ